MGLISCPLNGDEGRVASGKIKGRGSRSIQIQLDSLPEIVKEDIVSR
jgi:hypothetical protein